MKTMLFLFLFLSSHAFAYTFNNNFAASFKDDKVKIYIDKLTTCSMADVSVFELKDLIESAVDKFWNKVPTSKLRLKFGGFSSHLTNVNSGRLCAPTDDECITDAGSSVIEPAKDIIIACNDNVDNFPDPNVIAVTIPNHFSGKKIVGAVILINDRSDIFSTLSKSDRIGVLAHEIGHAIGLGHTDDKAALMYYRTVDQRKSLGEDDIRGVSYLYPMQLDMGGLLGGCGTIQNVGTPPTNPPFWQMGVSLGLLVLLAELRKLLKRSKAGATT